MGRLTICKRTIAAAYLAIACAMAIGPLVFRFRRPPMIVIEAVGHSNEDPATEQPFEGEPGNGDGEADGSPDMENREERIAVDDGTAEAPPQIFVHVAGHVAKPGLYAVASSSRVHHAIEAAGGMTDKADKDAVNIALRIVDGQQVYIPEKRTIAAQIECKTTMAGEEQEKEGSGAAFAPQDRLDVTITVPGQTDPEESKAVGLVDINSAGQSELETLPGIGPSLAVRIIDHRMSNGPFANVEDLMEVSGIGPAKLEALKGKVIVR